MTAPQIRPTPNTAIVTGASSGIGAAYARRLAERGFDLVLVARRTHRPEQLANSLTAQYGVRVERLTADVAEPADVELVADRVAGDDVSLLLDNAGTSGYGPFDQLDPAVLTKVLTVNAMTPLRVRRPSSASLPTARACRRTSNPGRLRTRLR